jgi:hypothetical protein
MTATAAYARDRWQGVRARGAGGGSSRLRVAPCECPRSAAEQSETCGGGVDDDACADGDERALEWGVGHRQQRDEPLLAVAAVQASHATLGGEKSMQRPHGPRAQLRRAAAALGHGGGYTHLHLDRLALSGSG